MKKVFITSAIIFSALHSYAQSTALQDKSGVGTINVGANQVSFNAGDASFTANAGMATTIEKKNKVLGC